MPRNAISFGPVSRWVLPALILGLLPAAGCRGRSFSAEGRLSSTGGRLGTWSGTPVSCTRASFLGPGEGLPAGSPMRSVLTLAWDDPTHYDPYRDIHMEHAGDAPLHLSLATRSNERGGQQELIASLDTLKHKMGLRLDARVCRTLQFERHERPSAIAGARTSLDGRLTLDCMADRNHITGDVRFTDCGY